jgi:hypothetical protein
LCSALWCWALGCSAELVLSGYVMSIARLVVYLAFLGVLLGLLMHLLVLWLFA